MSARPAAGSSHQHLGLHFSLSEMMALSELADEGAMSQQRLAELLGLEKSTVSRLAAGVEWSMICTSPPWLRTTAASSTVSGV